VHETRLADARNALEQHVAARQQTGDGQLDDFVVADDPASDLGGDARETILELGNRLTDG